MVDSSGPARQLLIFYGIVLLKINAIYLVSSYTIRK